MNLNIQKYVHGIKYHKFKNKRGERKESSLFNTSVLTNGSLCLRVRKSNTRLKNCTPCHDRHKVISDLHVSAQATGTSIVSSLCENLTDAIRKASSSTGTKNTEKKCEVIMKNMVKEMQPIVQSKQNIQFTNVLSVTSRTDIDELHDLKSKTKEIEKEMTGNHVSNFLASGKSYNLYDRDRMATYFKSRQVNVLASSFENYKHTKRRKKTPFDL